MKKQQQIDADEAYVNNEFTRQIAKNTKKTSNSGKNIVKWVRLIQITVLVLATLLLMRQNFLYAMALGVAVAATTAELIYNLVFREK